MMFHKGAGHADRIFGFLVRCWNSPQNLQIQLINHFNFLRFEFTSPFIITKEPKSFWKKKEQFLLMKDLVAFLLKTCHEDSVLKDSLLKNSCHCWSEGINYIFHNETKQDVDDSIEDASVRNSDLIMSLPTKKKFIFLNGGYKEDLSWGFNLHQNESFYSYYQKFFLENNTDASESLKSGWLVSLGKIQISLWKHTIYEELKKNNRDLFN